jgi:plastocyanin
MRRNSSNGIDPEAGGRHRLTALAGLGTLAVLAVALSACGSGGGTTSVSGTGSQSQGADNVKLVVKSDEQKGKKGSDGNWHDAVLPADFSVEAGDVVHVTVYNYDDMPHSFTSPGLGTNATIAAGAEEKPSKTTFTFHAPQKAGSYEWLCTIPCDPWAMSHEGFMRGSVTVG